MTFASVWQRFGAFLLDYLIIAAYIVLLIIVSVGLGFGPLRSVFRAMFADPNISEFSAFLLLVLPVILYFALFERSSWEGLFNDTYNRYRCDWDGLDGRSAQSLVSSHSRSFS